MQASAQQVTGDTYAAARTGRSVIARATAYSSHAAQTDSTPNITATGTRTRPGVIALSRDLLRAFPYGTRVIIEDLSGKYNGMLKNRVFIVEDTMDLQLILALVAGIATILDRAEEENAEAQAAQPVASAASGRVKTGSKQAHLASTWAASAGVVIGRALSAGWDLTVRRRRRASPEPWR